LSRSPNKAPSRPRPAALSAQIYQAGCARTWTLAAAEPDLAYTDLVFAECPECPHRVTPDGGPDFCTLRPQGAAHPFAALAALKLT